MHLSDGDLQSLADRELAPPRVTAALEHVAGCRDCADRLRDLEAMAARTLGLLFELDHPAPAVRLEAVVARAGRYAVRRRRALAAGVGGALLAAAAAAAAVPGTPLHRWVQRALPGARPQQPGPAAAPAAAGRAASGVAFVPEGAVEIVFRSTQAAGLIRVALTDSDAARVTGVGAGYALTDHGVEVDNAGSVADYDVVLPRRTARATVRVGQRVVLSKDGSRVVTAGGRERGGAWIIAFADLRSRAP